MTASRAIAMARKCKRRGGDCPCADHCQAMNLLQKEMASLQRQQRDLDFELVRISVSPATWRKEVSKSCPDPAFDHPVVIHTGDGWMWGWEDENGDFYEAEAHAVPWPWDGDYVYWDDWKREGFEIVWARTRLE